MNLTNLRALAEAATPGPWQAWRRGNSPLSSGVLRGLSELKGVEAPYGETSCHKRDLRAVYMADEDADFVAAARTAVPWLLDEVRRMRVQLGGLKGWCERNGHDYALTLVLAALGPDREE